MSEIGSIVGIGNSPEKAFKELEKHSEGHETWAMRLEIDLESVESARKDLEKGLR